MSFSLRPFTAADYAAVVSINNLAYPEYGDTVEDWQYSDSIREPHCKFMRWVAERNDQIIGFGEYSQRSNMYHPQKFEVYGVTTPAARGQGIGTALYAQIIAALEPFEPLTLSADAREDMDYTVRFLHKQGFREGMRSWESRLDVANFDPEPFRAEAARAEAAGIVIKSLHELAASDPAYQQKLYVLNTALVHDVPSPKPHTDISFEAFKARVFDSPNFLPDAFFVAVDDDAYVGLSGLWSSSSPTDLYTGLTGVQRSHRRKGIALALKMRGIDYAKASGATNIKTWNESNNRPMLAINERLGYVKQPIWINFSKRLREENTL